MLNGSDSTQYLRLNRSVKIVMSKQNDAILFHVHCKAMGQFRSSSASPASFCIGCPVIDDVTWNRGLTVVLY